MYISNMSHFLDKSGNIAKKMPKEARELASFMALVIDAVTHDSSSGNEIRCFMEGCSGTIKSYISSKNEIEWNCSACDNMGKISEWQETKWNNRRR